MKIVNAVLHVFKYTFSPKIPKNKVAGVTGTKSIRKSKKVCTNLLLISMLDWSKNPVSSQTDQLTAGTKFSDYLGLKHYKKAK